MDLTGNGEHQEMTCLPNRRDIFSRENLDNCKRYVLSIQRRLDKAVANSDNSRIKWYSHLLLKRSRAVKVLAVSRICKVNQGKHTAGVDGIATPEDKTAMTAFMESQLDDIDVMKKPDKIRRVYIPKPDGDKRPLGIPTIKDRIVQDVIRQTIEPICECHFIPTSSGFRPKRSCQDAMSDLFIRLGKKNARQWIVEGDIKGCFNHIRHSHITDTLKDWKVRSGLVKQIGKILKSGIMEEGVMTSTTEGTPQGGVISPMLANVALTSMDYAVQKRYTTPTYPVMIPIIRYADDFVVVANTEPQAQEIKAYIKGYLSEKVGLELSDKKTRITHISKGFDFLGFNFRKYKDKLLIKPSKENIQKLKKKAKQVINSCATSEQIIWNLNPITIGWGNYYRHVVSSDVFANIDYYVWKTLWRWTQKRFPTRGAKYRFGQHFRKIGQWVFTDGKNFVRLMSKIPIRRFVKVKNDKRVYDAEAIDYWKKREYANATKSIYIADSTISRLFTKQKGNCAVCKQPITDTDVKGNDIHQHHVKPRSEGGDNKSGNLRLVHAGCHTKLHGMFSRKEMSDLVDKRINYVDLLKLRQ
jgi:RNA-directed DNA polymerase